MGYSVSKAEWFTQVMQLLSDRDGMRSLTLGKDLDSQWQGHSR